MIIIRVESIPGVSPVGYMPDYGDQAPDPSLPEEDRPKPVGLLVLDQRSQVMIELSLQDEERRAIIALLDGRRPVQTASADQMPGGIHIPGR